MKNQRSNKMGSIIIMVVKSKSNYFFVYNIKKLLTIWCSKTTERRWSVMLLCKFELNHTCRFGSNLHCIELYCIVLLCHITLSSTEVFSYYVAQPYFENFECIKGKTICADAVWLVHRQIIALLYKTLSRDFCSVKKSNKDIDNRAHYIEIKCGITQRVCPIFWLRILLIGDAAELYFSIRILK